MTFLNYATFSNALVFTNRLEKEINISNGKNMVFKKQFSFWIMIQIIVKKIYKKVSRPKPYKNRDVIVFEFRSNKI